MSAETPSGPVPARTRTRNQRPANRNPGSVTARKQKCTAFQAGNCRFGDRCKFSHEVVARIPVDREGVSQVSLGPAPSRSTHALSPVSTTTSTPTNAATSSNRNGTLSTAQTKRACRDWAKGLCPRGNSCVFEHDLAVLARELQTRLRKATEKRVEAARLEAARLEAARLEAARLEAARLEAARLEAARLEAARLEAARLVAARLVAARLEAARLAAVEVARIRAVQEAEANRVAAQREAECARLRQVAEAEARAAQRAEAKERQRQARLAREEAARAEANRQAELAAERERAKKAVDEARLAEEERLFVAKAALDAADTLQTAIFGSTVTFAAGLQISGIITGFQSCRIHVKNLPLDAKISEVSHLFTQQGVTTSSFHILSLKREGKLLGAEIIADLEAGHALAAGLEGIEFRNEHLVFEVTENNSSGDAMSATSGVDSDILTVSWRGSSDSYVAEYADMEQARSKVRELDGRECAGRKVRVEMNTLPPGVRILSFCPTAIKIIGLPFNVGDATVIAFTGSYGLKRLPSKFARTDEQCHYFLRQTLDGASGHDVQSYDIQPRRNDGTLTVRVRFSSWERAKLGHSRLNEQKFPQMGNTPIWLRLPDPLAYTITVTPEQYRVQKAQWASLVQTAAKTQGACKLSISELRHIVNIRVLGSDEEAIGRTKVRVESLAAGTKVDRWLQSLGKDIKPFLARVARETGSFIRPDYRQHHIRVFGSPETITLACERIETEIARLATLEWNQTLQRRSVGFFIRRGVPALKEAFGEESVSFNTSSCKITVIGGEPIIDALNKLVEESLQGVAHPPTVGEHVCPICFDTATAPVRLGCDHVYCEACLRHFLTAAADSKLFPIACMSTEGDGPCHVGMSIPTIQRFLTQQAFIRLLEAGFLSHIDSRKKEYKYCKTPDCVQIYRVAEGASRPGGLKCPSCLDTVCSACDEKAHPGMTCEERRLAVDPSEQDRLAEEWMRKAGAKKCPSCKAMIEKIDGCNHMSCPCGAHICWRCMGEFTPANIYQHMNNAHGGMNGDEDRAVDPNIYREQEQALEVLRQQRLARQAEDNRRALEDEARRREEAQRRATMAYAPDGPQYDPRVVVPQPTALDLARRDAEEQIRRLTEYRLRQAQERQRLREAEERQRRERAQRDANAAQAERGWGGCFIM